jgi:hypothetical protein
VLPSSHRIHNNRYFLEVGWENSYIAEQALTAEARAEYWERAGGRPPLPGEQPAGCGRSNGSSGGVGRQGRGARPSERHQDRRPAQARQPSPAAAPRQQAAPPPALLPGGTQQQEGEGAGSQYATRSGRQLRQVNRFSPSR